MSEDERVALMYEINGDYLNDERSNLNIQLSRPILVIGDLELWHGRRMGYKEIESGNISDCLCTEQDIENATWLSIKTAIFVVKLSTTTGQIIISTGFIKTAFQKRRLKI